MKKRYIAGGIVAAVVIIGAASSCGGEGDKPSDPRPTHTATPTSGAPEPSTGGGGTGSGSEPTSAAKKPQGDQVVFKVWGSAPSGVDITYGSDGTNLQGSGLPMTKTMKLKGDALYYQVTAQLKGGGDIHCSVTVKGKTKEGRAQGGYNICSAQANGGLFGW